MGLNCTCPLTYGLFVNVFYFPYDFLNNVFFSLAYFMIRIQYIIYITYKICVNKRTQDGGNIGGSGVHFPSTPGKYLADLKSRANSQQYSSIYEDQRPKIEDTERSDGKKSAQGQ